MSRDRIGALLLLVFFVAYGYLSTSITLLPFQLNQAFHARTAPQFLTFVGIVLGLFLLVVPGDDRPVDTSGMTFTRVAVLCGLMIFYGLTVRLLGFHSFHQHVLDGRLLDDGRAPMVGADRRVDPRGRWVLAVDDAGARCVRCAWPEFLG
jgi:hypothetical protein